MDDPDTSRTDLKRLIDLIARLRAPDGCPWDRKQTLGDVRAYLLEEAHETAAALDSGDREELAGELGDLLFQIAFIARLAEEEGSFTAADAVERIHAKMIARHPHVFAPGGEVHPDAAAVERAWERGKLDEAGRKSGDGASLLAGVPFSLPALTGAYRITQKAAGVGFDWPEASAVLTKIDEELGELRAEIAAAAGDAASEPDRRRRMAEELGDLLFTVANLARKLEIDPEAALAGTNAEFRRRFAFIEERLAAAGRRPDGSSLAEMDALWEEAKRA